MYHSNDSTPSLTSEQSPHNCTLGKGRQVLSFVILLVMVALVINST